MRPTRALVQTVVAVLVLAVVAAGAVIAGRHDDRLNTAGAAQAAQRSPSPRPTTTPPSTVPLASSTTAAAPGPAPGPAPAPVPVAPMGRLQEADALVSLPGAAAPADPASLLNRIAALPHVQAAEMVDTGTVQLAGGPAATLGVDPGSFRNFTPQVTAASDQLWQYIADGSLASSYDMARDRKLSLGATVPVVAAGSTEPPADRWLGAFMSVGLPGIDLVVGRGQGADLHLKPNSGVVVSAPKADQYALQTALKQLAPGADVELMRPGIAIGGTGGSYLTAAQTSTVLSAALSRVGMPYVWGATGPNGFDCSGLVGWAFAAAGIAMPRTAAQQALAGPQVPLTQVRPGDLLLWAYDPNDPRFIDHVAIYLGNSTMVVAPQTGELVQVARVNTDHLVGAVRVDPATAARVGGPRWP